MDLVRLAYYPFLPEVKEAARSLGPGVVDLLSGTAWTMARRRGRARVEAALTSGRVPPAVVTDERAALQELLSVPVAKMLLTVLRDRMLNKRYAEAEARRVEDALSADQDPAAIQDAASALEVPLEPEGDGWRIRFTDFLRVAPLSEPGWKLVQQTVDEGWITLARDRAVHLVANALRDRILAELEEEQQRPVPADLREGLKEHLDALAPILAKARETWDTGDFGPVQRSLFPPCITDIFQQMMEGRMVPHHGRFAMASFLGTIGMKADDIMDFFQEIPNFDPEKSRYQIQHITGDLGVEQYTPPGCAWMQTNGVCPLEKRDNLCFKIKHPLSYYRARIRFQKQDAEKAKRMLQKARTDKAPGKPKDPGDAEPAPAVAERDGTTTEAPHG